jgi:hypothetical protein
LEQGPTEKAIIEQCYRQRIPLPSRIANAPELLLGLEFYYAAFLNLTSCRTQGYGTEGPIGWLTTDEYADRNAIEGEQREDLHYHIQKLDAAYLEFKGKKLEAKTKPKSAPRKK